MVAGHLRARGRAACRGSHRLRDGGHSLRSSASEDSSSSQGWGKVVAQYIHDQWVCLSFMLNKYHALIPAAEGELLDPTLPAIQRPGRTLRSALDALSVLPAQHVSPVLRCMKTLVPKVRPRGPGRSAGGRWPVTGRGIHRRQALLAVELKPCPKGEKQPMCGPFGKRRQRAAVEVRV